MTLLVARGQQLGPYRICQVVGTGGFGTVYEAIDLRTGTRVALKVPHHQDRGREYLMYEPSLLAKLQHPNVVQLLDATTHEGLFFFVMEFVEGQPLSQRLDEEHILDWAEAVGIIRQVAEAVRFAHQHRILHRDLRPANILLRSDGVVKVTDFGIAKWLRDTDYAHTVIGSPPYMAPEQLEGKATFASDVYSMGIVLYEMVTGQVPYFDVNFVALKQKILQGQCSMPHQLRPEVPIPISRFIMKAIERKRSLRFQTADEFLQALDLAVQSVTRRSAHAGSPPRPPETVRIPTPSQRRRYCWNCGRVLHEYAVQCPACGEAQ
jgi:serine/threonine-protein kinase